MDLPPHTRNGGVEISVGLVPNWVALVTQLHAEYYRRHWGFGTYFADKVAVEAAEFEKRYDPARDRIWSVLADGALVASITIDGRTGSDTGGHLRWFITDAAFAGRGLGTRLICEAIAFCRASGYPKIFLTTFAGLNAARHLYLKHGFRLVHAQRDTNWGNEVEEQRFELNLGKSGTGQ